MIKKSFSDYIEINLGKKFWAIISIAYVILISGIVFAVDPSIYGHDSSEINGLTWNGNVGELTYNESAFNGGHSTSELQDVVWFGSEGIIIKNQTGAKITQTISLAAWDAIVTPQIRFNISAIALFQNNKFYVKIPITKRTDFSAGSNWQVYLDDQFEQKNSDSQEFLGVYTDTGVVYGRLYNLTMEITQEGMTLKSSYRECGCSDPGYCGYGVEAYFTSSSTINQCKINNPIPGEIMEEGTFWS